MDEELLLKALQEADAELPDAEQEESSSQVQETPPQHQGPTSIIGKGINAWKSVGAGMVNAAFETKDFVFGEPEQEDKSEFRQLAEKRFTELKGENVVNSAAFSISQMVTGLLGAGKIMKPVKALQKVRQGSTAGKVGYEIGKGALASTVVLDPHEERLSDLIEEFPALQNPVTDYLSSDPEDSTAEGRFKNAIESIGLDFALVGAVKAIKLLKAGKKEEALKEIAKLETGTQAPDADAVLPPGTDRKAQAAARMVEETNVDSVRPDPMVNVADEASPVPSDVEAPKRADAEDPGLPTTGKSDPQATPKEDVTEQIGMGQPIGPNGQRIIPTDIKEPGVLRVKEVTDKELDDILRGSQADSRAIKKYGSVAEARANGYKFGANTKLPWQKLRGTTEVMTFVRQTAKVLKGRYDVAKGGARLGDARVRDVTNELAEAFNEDPAVILGQITEMGAKAAQVVPYMEASLRIGNKMFLDADRLASDIRMGNLDAFAGNAEAAQAELKARIAAAVDVMANANSMLSNSGRALRRARTQFKVRDADLASIKNLDPAKLAIIMEKAEGDPRKIMMLANRKWSDRVMDNATWHLTNGLLWLWPTHLVNMTTNAAMMVARPTEKLFGSTALRMVTKDPGRRAELSSVSRQALREYTYTMTSLADGWFAAVEAFRRGDSILSPHNTEYFQSGTNTMGPEVLPWKPVKSVWDLAHNAWVSANYRTIVGLPTRALGGADEMFKTMRYRAVIQSKAAVDAADMNLSAADTKAYIQKALNMAIDPDTGRALDAKALRESQMVGFQQDLDYDVTIGGSLGRSMVSARRVAPALSLVLPFVKTPVNVIRYGIKLTPGLNLAQKEFRDALRGVAGAEAQAHAVGQMALGGMFASLAAGLALNGKFTGSGPSDFKLKQELMATGWRPYSYVYEDEEGNTKYFQAGRFDPAGMVMGMVADVVYQSQIDPERNMEEAAGAIVIALAKNLGEKTFLLNLNTAIQAALEPDKNLSKWAGRTVGSMLPASSLMRGHNPDPYLREARGFIDSMIRGVPGLSETLPKSYDVFGDPVERTVGLIGSQKSDLVEAEHNRIMLQTSKGLGKPDPKFEGVDLRDITLNDGLNAYEAFQQLSGHLPGRKSLRQVLEQEIRKAGYQDLPDGEAGIKGTRLNRLGALTQKYREAARKELVRKYPELKPYIKARQKEARGALITNRQQRLNGEPGARELLEALTPR